MTYVISGLPLQPFQPLFDLDDAALRARGIARQVADAKPGFPCRITLQDAEPGERLLLLPWRHLDVDTPYRADGPIFVRESARDTAVFRDTAPNSNEAACCRYAPTTTRDGCATRRSPRAYRWIR